MYLEIIIIFIHIILIFYLGTSGYAKNNIYAIQKITQAIHFSSSFF